MESKTIINRCKDCGKPTELKFCYQCARDRAREEEAQREQEEKDYWKDL